MNSIFVDNFAFFVNHKGITKAGTSVSDGSGGSCYEEENL
jgi:hypothetical protein